MPFRQSFFLDIGGASRLSLLLALFAWSCSRTPYNTVANSICLSAIGRDPLVSFFSHGKR